MIYTIDIAGMTIRAKLFMNGRSQAVRLPKEFRFSGSEVCIERRGEAVVLTPVDAKWARVVRELPTITEKEADVLRSVVTKNRKRRPRPRDFDW